jgi:hypothetical protein
MRGNVDPKGNVSWRPTGSLTEGGSGEEDFPGGGGVVKDNLIRLRSNSRKGLLSEAQVVLEE